MIKIKVKQDFTDYSYYISGKQGDVLTVEGAIADSLIKSSICEPCETAEYVSDEEVKPKRRTRKKAE